MIQYEYAGFERKFGNKGSLEKHKKTCMLWQGRAAWGGPLLLVDEHD